MGTWSIRRRGCSRRRRAAASWSARRRGAQRGTRSRTSRFRRRARRARRNPSRPGSRSHATAEPAERPRTRGPFVGRRRELDLIRSVWQQATLERRPHVVTVVGPPGIGKSRLARETTAEVEAAGGRMIRGRCLPYEEQTGYHATAQLVRRRSRSSTRIPRAPSGPSSTRASDPSSPALRPSRRRGTSVCSSASRRMRPSSISGSCSSPSADCSRASGTSGRRWSSTRTSTGPRRASWISSSTSAPSSARPRSS